MSQLPSVTQRGSFNAINASIQQFSGGLASVIAGHIVMATADGHLLHMDLIGYCVIAAAVMAVILLSMVQRAQASVQAQTAAAH